MQAKRERRARRFGRLGGTGGWRSATTTRTTRPRDPLFVCGACSERAALDIAATDFLALASPFAPTSEAAPLVTVCSFKSGLVSSTRVGQADRRDRKVYELTETGRDRVTSWLADLSWPKPAPAEFHLKLVAVAAAGLADPVGIVDLQRRELLLELREAERAALAEPDDSVAALLLEGVVLRLQADLRWLEACARYWNAVRGKR